MPTVGHIEPTELTGSINDLNFKKKLTQPNGIRGQDEDPIVSVAVKSDILDSALSTQ